MVSVVKGIYKGASGTVTRTTPKKVTIRLASSFSICPDEDDCWCADECNWYSGDTITVEKKSILEGNLGEKNLLDQKIKDSVTSLRGLLLKKKMLENPVDSEVEIKRLLEIVDVEV